MSKNETLAFRDLVYEIEKKAPERKKIKALPEEKQKVFNYLNGLSGKELTEALNEWRND